MSTEKRTGIVNALAAYGMWGVAPIYFKLLHDLPAIEILMHRIVWSLLLLLCLIAMLKKWRNLQQLLKQPQQLKLLLAAGFLLGVNWLIFIYAINSDQILEASLGYYINPLLNVLFGFLLLGERFRFWQKVAIGLACVGVINQLIAQGSLPVIALALAGTFCVYGLLRKKAAVDSFTGLTLETALLMPLAIVYWCFFATSEYTNMMENGLTINFWLVMAGVVTTAPLLCFNAAAKRMSFTSLGLFQYIGPSLMFLVAVIMYNEPLRTDRLITFAFIWAALLIFSWDSVRNAQSPKKI
jgi:chloramphenicol-sensitive protein RarD